MGRPKMTAARRQLFEMHGGVCTYCRRQTEMPSALPNRHHDLTATVEHIVPISLGGGVRGENTTLACWFCNNLKGSMSPQQWAEFMMMNPKWWERAKRVSASNRRFARRADLPIEETKMILREGKKAWKRWVDQGRQPSVEMRPLRPDEPLPIEYDDPKSQAAFEAHARKNRHNLRVPLNYAAPASAVME